MTPALMSKRFRDRKNELRLSSSNIASLSGVSLRTVQRVLSGQDRNPSYETVSSIAKVLGIGLMSPGYGIEMVRRRHAVQKARRLVGMVQATSALEAQAVPVATLRKLRKRAARELLGGSPRRLWG